MAYAVFSIVKSLSVSFNSLLNKSSFAVNKVLLKDFRAFLEGFNTSSCLFIIWFTISSFVLNYKNQNCTPIICENANLNQNADKQAIINLIIKKFPFIDDTVRWEKIIEFKANTDAKNKLNALKNWLTDISKNNYTVTEVEQKLDYFIDEYESLLKLHKLKVKYKKFDLILTSTVGTIENLIKLNFTDIGKNLLTLKEEKINLKIEEKNLKGQEIAYISNIITHFDNDKSKLVKNCL